MSRSFRVRVDSLAKKTPAPAQAESTVASVKDASSVVPGKDEATDAAQKPVTAPSQTVADKSSCVEEKTHTQAPGHVPEIYGDVCVCQALGIKRRHIAAARTKGRRGTDWDVIGLHAGMTMDWIQRTALEMHVVPVFSLLKRIEPGDNVVSCSLAAVVPNNRRAIVDVVATGDRRIVWVKDSSMMRLREIFDCYDDHGTLSATRELNEVMY